MIAPLGKMHDRAGFACGEASLDAYLKTQATQDIRRDLSACYVLTARDDGTIIGYYTLSATSIDVSTLPPALSKHVGRYALIPAVLLGRLAVDHRFQGQGMSALLLVNALRRIVRIGIGIKLIVVDALHEHAAAFYLHYHFQRLADHPLRLFLPVKTIREMYPDLVPPASLE